MKIRIFIENIELSNEDSFTFEKKTSADLYHYLINVLKIKIGQKIYFFSENIEKLYIVNEINKSSISFSFEINTKLSEDISSNPSLIFPIIKQDKIIQIVKQATELGVSNFYPFISERTQELRNFNIEKIQKNIIESLEQSNGLKLPVIHEPQNIFKILEKITNGKILLGYTTSNEIKNKRIYSNKEKYGSCIVGPEGGFSENEIKKLEEIKNIEFISIGTRILRSETAAIVLLSKIL